MISSSLEMASLKTGERLVFGRNKKTGFSAGLNNILLQFYLLALCLFHTKYAAGVSGTDGTHDVALSDDHQITGEQVAFITQQIHGILSGRHAVVLAVKEHRRHTTVNRGQVQRMFVTGHGKDRQAGTDTRQSSVRCGPIPSSR